MFVCFAPKEDPKIAIAVTVKMQALVLHGGLLQDINGKISERYFTNKKQEDLERISNTNLMPKYYIRKQKVDDSIRAFQWFKMTKTVLI
jgi:penicillin-binding protein 2